MFLLRKSIYPPLGLKVDNVDVGKLVPDMMGIDCSSFLVAEDFRALSILSREDREDLISSSMVLIAFSKALILSLTSFNSSSMGFLGISWLKEQ